MASALRETAFVVPGERGATDGVVAASPVRGDP
jgi:hypothetical protein